MSNCTQIKLVEAGGGGGGGGGVGGGRRGVHKRSDAAAAQKCRGGEKSVVKFNLKCCGEDKQVGQSGEEAEQGEEIN